MSGKSLLIILLFLLWCAFSTWYYNCKIKGLCYEPQNTVQDVEAKVDDTAKENIANNSTAVESPLFKGFRFQWNSDSAQVENVSDHIQQNVIMNFSADEKVLITGKYFVTESYSGDYENLGFARAHAAKNYFLEFLTEDKIDLSSEIQSQDSSLTESMDLITFKAISPEKEKEVAKRDGKVLIYFDSNSDNPIFGDGVIAYLDEVAEKLREDKYKSIIATGFTDEIGNPKNNYYMGLHRATAVKDYLISKGCHPNQIELKSYGEYRPVAENSSEEGRAKNRRVEIKLNF